MRIYCLRTDLIMLDVRSEPTEEQRPYTYWRDQCREVPDELIDNYNKAMDELDKASDAVEKAFNAAAMNSQEKPNAQ